MGILQRAPRLANGLRDPGKDVEYSRICRLDTQIRCYRCLGRAELKASVASHHMLSNMVELIGHSGRPQPNEDGPIRAAYAAECVQISAGFARPQRRFRRSCRRAPPKTRGDSHSYRWRSTVESQCRRAWSDSQAGNSVACFVEE